MLLNGWVNVMVCRSHGNMEGPEGWMMEDYHTSCN